MVYVFIMYTSGVVEMMFTFFLFKAMSHFLSLKL